MSLDPPTRYDTVIIGSGPAGEGAAMQLTKGGQNVCVVEARDQVGGGCTHQGTIPSKALRQVVARLSEYNRSPLFGQKHGHIKLSYPEALSAATSTINQQVELRSGFYERNNVPVLHGRARFSGPNQVTVDRNGNNQSDAVLEADHFVIATGSRPYRPEEIDFTHPRVFDADTILKMDHTPRSIAIYGAGVIGCEYAGIFRGLGMKVHLINTRDQLLSFLDDEIVDALTYHLRDQGINVRHNETLARVEPNDDGVHLHLKSGKCIHVEALLFANGRSGNTLDMGLEALNLDINHRGQIEVNSQFETDLAHIHAAGDVIGPPGLASASYDQGRWIGQKILGGGQTDAPLPESIPTGIYTWPEISSLGPTERELTEQCIPYEVGRAYFKHLARAQILGVRVGMLKVLFAPDSREILAIHCFGSQASEIIHIGQAIMAQEPGKNTLDYFTQTTFNYPTMAEAWRVAALNGMNRL